MPRAKKASTALVLRLDSEKLNRDGLRLTGEVSLARFLGQHHLRLDVTELNATDVGDLHVKLAGLDKKSATFDLIVVIAHSNEAGIRIASDRFVEWLGFAKYLERFEPKRLALIACQAGGGAVSRILFDGVPSLHQICASPENVSISMANLILAMCGLLLGKRSADLPHITTLKGLALFGVGSRLKVWNRNQSWDVPGLVEDFLLHSGR